MGLDFSSITSGIGTLTGLISVTPNVKGYQPQAKPVSIVYSPPKNLGALNPPSFLFHYEGEQTVALESDITDHYVEDNSAIQDQIALRPETITTQGFVGELNDVVPELLAPFKAITEKLTVISAYTPAISATAMRAYNTAVIAYDATTKLAQTGISTLTSLFGGSTKNKQQEYFQKFYNYWKNRTLFTVQTPWEVFPNMAIKSLRATQDADTRVISAFEVTFKAIRFAETIVSVSNPLGQGRYNSQSSTLKNNGTSTPAFTLGLNTQLSNKFSSSFPGVS